MSVDCLSWAFKNSKSEGSARLVLFVLSDHAGQGGWACYPSIARIAAYANCSDSTVRRALKELVDLGELEIDPNGSFDNRQRNDRKTNLYRVFPRVGENGVSQVTGRDDNGVSESPERGVKTGPNGVSLVTHKPVMNRKEPQVGYPQVQGPTYQMPQPRPYCAVCDKWTDGEGPKELRCECPPAVAGEATISAIR